MTETISIEQAVIEKLRSLSRERQQEVLDFVEFLCQKTTNSKGLSLQQIATLPLEERHKLISPFIAQMAEDFRTDPELTEFAVLDSEDWDLENEQP